jgi:dipeptidyl aminopeptidase/acylaminoacyl peptidase
MKKLHKVVFTFCLALVAPFAASAAEVPVADFFKDPEFTSVSLSPTGEFITVSVPQGDRTVLAAFRVADMSLVGKWDYGAKKHIDRVLWVNDERFLMFVSLKLGKFDFRVGTPDVYASNVDGTQRADMPNLGVYQIADVSWDDPRTILVQRSVESAFLSKYDVYNGRVTTVATAPIRFGSFVLDHEGKVRYAVGEDESQQGVTMRREGERWVPIHNSTMGGDVHLPLMFTSDNRQVYFATSTDGAPAAVVLVDPETGEQSPVAANPNVDPDETNYLVSSDGKELLAIRFSDGVPAYSFVNPQHPESLTYAGLINAFPNHAVVFRGISRDGRFVLVRTFSDVDPGSFYLFDRQTGKAKFLLASMDWIKPEQMSETQPIAFTARDGRKVHGFLTIPRGSDGRNLPLVFHPHGGPHGVRDDWGFNPEVQFLANRGYAVLQVNFRGSGGYGNEHMRIGYRNWGTTMINDMTDAIDWTIAQGIVDKDRICTYGASYGGYAALQTVVREPTKYQCAIGYVGVYSLPLMFKDGDIPEQESGMNFLRQVMPETLADQQAQSPAYNVDKINIPVMIVSGARDLRVPMSQHDSLVDRLIEAGKAPEVVIVEDKEGHGFYDLQNNVDLHNAMEAFLDKHTGAPAAAAETP